MTNRTWSPWIALGAMGLALGLALANRPDVAGASGAAWPEAVESGADHITATELATRLLDAPDEILLVDVRPAEDFAGFHLPDSHNLTVPELLGARGKELLLSNQGKLVVLCSQGMTHPAQAWVELSRRGERDVRVLEDGLDGFVRDVLTPPSLRGAPSDAAGVALFHRAREQFLPGGRAEPAASPAAQGAPKAQGAPAVTPQVARLATDPERLAQPTLVSTAWLAKRGAEVVILDAREKPEDYAAGHLPRALHVPVKAWRAELAGVPDELLPRDELAAAVGALGIDADTEVVAYGDDRLQDPAQLVLALSLLGHSKLAILEGGFGTWRAEGRPVETETITATPRVYVPNAVSGVKSAALADVVEASTGGGVALLDVRPADAFRGEVSTEARAGHIPGSLNRPYTQDVVKTPDGLAWKPLEELRADYLALGLKQDAPVIVSCRTGHQAAQTWFTLRHLLGYEDVRWYDGSWKEWSARTELPVALGEAGR